MAMRGKWKHKLLYISGDGKYSIDKEDLIETMKDHVDKDDYILNVTAYRVLKLGCRNWFCWHTVIVVNTLRYWWSIEKNSEVIAIQSSKDKSDVVDKFNGVKRELPLLQVKNSMMTLRSLRSFTDRAAKDVDAIIDWIYTTDQLDGWDRWGDCTCKKFGKDVYWLITDHILNV